MECPKCKTVLFCPCEHCKKNNKDKILWIWLTDGEIIKCPICDHKDHADNWE